MGENIKWICRQTGLVFDSDCGDGVAYIRVPNRIPPQEACVGNVKEVIAETMNTDRTARQLGELLDAVEKWQAARNAYRDDGMKSNVLWGEAKDAEKHMITFAAQIRAEHDSENQKG